MRIPVLKQGQGRYPMSETTRPCHGMPGPRKGERPTAYADRIGEWYAARRSDRHRKDHGLFLTPVAAADFMAGQITTEAQNVRVIDPAAGAGILCCAAVEALVSRWSTPSAIELVAYEFDGDLTAPLRAVLDHLSDWCRDRYQVTVAVHIEATDFIMANADALRPYGLFPALSEAGSFDVVIANPPYFKIGKHDPRAAAVSEVVHGQPNIYALFMALGAALLRQRGSFVFITPRSFASGPYFRRFRTVFFDMIQPTGIHVFGSRRNAFRRDAVLQENIIISGVRQDRWHKNEAAASLAISSSLGVDDIDESSTLEVSANAVLDFDSVDKVLRLPVCDDDEEVLALVDSWPCNLRVLGLNISTGPVVPFRATELVAGEGEVSRQPRTTPLDEPCASHAGHVAAEPAQARIHRAHRRRGAVGPQQELRSHTPLQCQGRATSADGGSLHRRRLLGPGGRVGEPS